jgi:pimeloyl-ACP methyl ester carboxylesterase
VGRDLAGGEEDEMSEVVSLDGTKIAFERHGQGPAVILIDGAMGYREHYGRRELAAAIAPSFAAYTYDRRGRGGSGDTLPYSVDREIEDIEALIDEAGGPVFLYGFSSGSVLALRAAARLSSKVTKLVLHEPPLEMGDSAKREFAEFSRRLNELLGANQRGEAVAFFLSGMLPAEMIEGMRKSPGWPVMESVAHTLAYDSAVLGDGTVPDELAKTVSTPTLIIVGDRSEEYKQEAADTLAQIMPQASRRLLEGEDTPAPPEAVAPVLVEFFQGAPGAAGERAA